MQALSWLVVAALVTGCKAAESRPDEVARAPSAAPSTSAPARKADAPSTSAPARKADAPSTAATPSPSGAAAVSPSARADAGVAWQLRCLAKHYDATVDGDALVTSRGERVPLRAPGARTLDERLDSTTAEDVFAPRYSVGPVAPVTDPGADPGRFRPTPVFRAVYGGTPAEVERGLVTVDFVGKKIRVHRRARPAFEAVSAKLAALVAADASLASWFEGMGGTYNFRPIAGTDRLSAHSFGVAIDLATARSHYWRNDGAKLVWKNLVPQSIVDAFESSGFVWGGRWYHYDTMHFEWRPEIFDPACRPDG